MFVFAVQTQTDPASYDPLDVSHWNFYVLGAAVIAQAGRSVGIAWVKRHAGAPVNCDNLNHAVRAAAGSHEPAVGPQGQS